MKNDLVSIIVPVYNSGKFLEECLDSLIEQTYKNLEIICIDDGSTDDSLEILNKYKMMDDRIIVLSQENKGQSIARNLGIEVSKGRYINFTDSDDVILPNTIEYSLNQIKTYQLDAVYYNMEIFTPKNNFVCLNGKYFEPSSPIMDTRKDEVCINFTNAAPALFDNALIKQNNITFPEGMLYEDWVFMCKFNIYAKKVYWYNFPFYRYRRKFEATSTDVITERCFDLFKAYKMADKLIKEANLTSLYSHINDAKIINESIGFYEANLLKTNNYKIKKEFLNNIQKIISNFPDAYLLSLNTHLYSNRSILNLIKQGKHKVLLSKHSHKYIKHLKKVTQQDDLLFGWTGELTTIICFYLMKIKIFEIFFLGFNCLIFNILLHKPNRFEH